MKKIPVGILGATSLIGQFYLSLLRNHPWFEVTFLAGSPRSANRKLKEAVDGSWVLNDPIPDHLTISELSDIKKAQKECHFVFSALGNEFAANFEELYAAAGIPVISNASCHRDKEDIPCLIAEINSDHLEIISQQKRKRGWEKGFIVTKPNCSVQSFMMPLTPLHHLWKIKSLHITTLQSLSGAGIQALNDPTLKNDVNPFIEGEEEKVEREPLKIWRSQEIKISAHCNRVPTPFGHFATVSATFEKKPDFEEILPLWESFEALPQKLNLPSAPARPILYTDELKNKAIVGSEMSTLVSRLRPCNLGHIRFTSLSHNAVRGGAGGGILNAELLYKLGYL